MKKIRIDTPNGTYAVPALIVAQNKAKYVAQADESSKRFKNLVEQYLRNDEDLLDWVHNSMDWYDVEPYAEIIAEDGDDDFVYPEGGEDFWFYSDNFSIINPLNQ